MGFRRDLDFGDGESVEFEGLLLSVGLVVEPSAEDLSDLPAAVSFPAGCSLAAALRYDSLR